MEKEREDSIAQSFLLVGNDGCGKTSLLYTILKECVGKKIGDMLLLPIYLNAFDIFSTEDIWETCALLLNISGESTLVNMIMDWQKKNSTRILLLIDDFHLYFARTTSQDQYVFRGNLSRPGAPILVCTSNSIPPQILDYDYPFFETFDVIYFPDFDSVERISELAGPHLSKRVVTLMEYLPKTIQSAVTALRIVRTNASEEDDLGSLLGIYSSVYAKEYFSLPKQMQNILNALSGENSPATLAEIRPYLSYDDGMLSPYMKLMVDRNIIVRTSYAKRNSKYIIADPLFAEWIRRKMATGIVRCSLR